MLWRNMELERISNNTSSNGVRSDDPVVYFSAFPEGDLSSTGVELCRITGSFT